MPRNPSWTRDELILALDLYFRVSPRHTSPEHVEITALSSILKRLPFHPLSNREKNFRSPDSVYLKLCNFLHLDPEYLQEGKIGLNAGSKLDREVWDRYTTARHELASLAAAIKSNFNNLEPDSIASGMESDDFPEGRILQRTHQLRERNTVLIRRKKLWTRENHGHLYCSVCGFDFEEKYGSLGNDFIECHHIQPLSSLNAETKTKLADLALVCANCHRMLHRIRPWISIDELRSRLH